jgi:hypothetical protein
VEEILIACVEVFNRDAHPTVEMLVNIVNAGFELLRQNLWFLVSIGSSWRIPGGLSEGRSEYRTMQAIHFNRHPLSEDCSSQGTFEGRPFSPSEPSVR